MFDITGKQKQKGKTCLGDKREKDLPDTPPRKKHRKWLDDLGTPVNSIQLLFKKWTYLITICCFNFPYKYWSLVTVLKKLYISRQKFVPWNLPIGSSLNCTPTTLVSARKNMPSAYEHAQLINDYLKPEVELNYIAGPFKFHLCQNSILTVFW